MIDRFFPHLKLSIPFDQFEAIPRNPAYKYEYFDNCAWLSPRPKSYHALLRLRPEVVPSVIDAQRPVVLRPLVEADWDHLPEVFAAAFQRVQPFCSLSDAKQLEASRACLDHTHAGRDGPLIDEACFVAVSQEDQRMCGGMVITLLPEGDPDDIRGGHWKEPPPTDWRERHIGRPHLTWIFVHRWDARFGVGGALLASVSAPLRALGYTELDSTFLLGNESSTLWHWRSGFELRPYFGSPRHWRKPPPPSESGPTT